MAIGEIKKEMKVNDFYAKSISQVRQLPRQRRCEICLSYVDFSLPFSIEICQQCYQSLVLRTEKQYTINKGFATRFFRCEGCGKKTLYKVEINPYGCQSCMRRLLKRASEIDKIRNREVKIHYRKK
jgi:hypothetical protein